jgi:hypothetical protein
MNKEQKQSSILAPLVSNVFIRGMLAQKIPKGATFVLITSDMFSDLTLQGLTQDFFLAELKEILCIWPIRQTPDPNDKSLHVRSVIVIRNGCILSFEVDRFYLLGELNLLAEDLYLQFESNCHDTKKI